MSKESVKDFLEEVSKNEDLQKQLKAATEGAKVDCEKMIQSQAEILVKIAKNAGYDFTVEDVLAAGKVENGRLDENELDAVAGGGELGGICFIFGYTSYKPDEGEGYWSKDGASAGLCFGFGVGKQF